MTEQIQTEEIVVPEVNVEIEKEARLQGWAPKEEFRGDETDWVDVETFVKRGREINPILRENNKRLMKEIEKYKSQMEDLRIATEEFKNFKTEQFEKKQQALIAEINDLKAQKKVAASERDVEKIVELDEKIEAAREEHASMKKEEKKEPPKSETTINPALNEWMDRNPWFHEDVGMAATANYEAEKLTRREPALRNNPIEFLKKLDEVLETIFNPERLGRQKKEKPRSPVEAVSGGSRPSKDGKKTYDDLPPEAKAACDKFVKQKLLTKEQYVEDYFA